MKVLKSARKKWHRYMGQLVSRADLSYAMIVIVLLHEISKG